MPEITTEELTIIENVLVTMREAIADDQSPEAQQMKQQIVEAEQIVSSKIEGSASQMSTQETAPAGPGV
jgi:hypothetical protein